MSEAYKVKNYRLPDVVYNHIKDLVLDIDNQTGEFFFHLLVGTLSNLGKNDGWTPISKKFITKEWPKANLAKLTNLIEVLDLGGGKTYDKDKGVCKSYRVRFDIVEEIFDRYPKDMSNVIYVNLMTGRRLPFKKHKLKNGTNSIPDLIKKGITGVERCMVNKQQLLDHMERLGLDIVTGEAQGRYLNDRYCYLTITQNNFKTLEDGSAQYEPSYRMQSTGRISEIGGGLQSCSREMKDAAFTGLDDVRNYDIKSSQVTCLLQWFEFANLDTSWLTTYLNSDKQSYANRVGISVDCWKQCLMALIFGANYNSSIKDYLLTEVGGDEELVKPLLDKFKVVVKDLKSEIDKWYDWLLNIHIPHISIYGKGGQKVYNPTGALFDLEYYKNIEGSFIDVPELKRKLGAFLLQGYEAAFIYHLTFISRDHGWEAVSNQHDGLVTIGEIPQKSIDYAREHSKFKYAEVVEKPLI